ncbi:MAG: nuclear transport factor 2 family protein [Litorimonas sp.]
MRPIFITVFAVLIVACQAAATPHPVVVAHVEAFNAGDIAAMGQVEHADIEWLRIVDSTVIVDVVGREELASIMTDYRMSNPTVIGTLRDWSVNGDYVSVTETASWVTEDGQKKAQSALTVYQIEDNLIRRVWYYPRVGQ